MAASSSSNLYCCSTQSLMSLQELDVGVVKTFHPTESELVGHYLYNKIFFTPQEKPTFPEIDIYGKTALPPWEIFNNYDKFPHQDYVYFFTHFKKLNPNGGSRFSRTVGGYNGGTWSETEPGRAVYVNGIDEPFGKLRKFRYEKNKDKSFEHHAGWLMEEYTINQQPDLALCRIKANERRRNYKRKMICCDDNDDQRKTNKKRRIEMSPPPPPTPISSVFEDDHVENGFCDELEQILSDGNLMIAAPVGLFNDDQALNDPSLMTSAEQLFGNYEEQQDFSDWSLVPQQQSEVQQQLQQEVEPCSAHYEWSLVPQQEVQQQQDEPCYSSQCEFDIPLDVSYIQSDEFNGFYFDQEQPPALEWHLNMDNSPQTLLNSDLFFEEATFPDQAL